MSTSDPFLFALMTVVITAGLVVCDGADFRRGRSILKPIASTGFVLTAWAAGALDSTYGRWVFVGLLFSWVGDVALLARGRGNAFKLGLVSFLLGHVAYSVGFVARGFSPQVALGAAAVLSIFAAVALRQLMPRLPESMQVPVRAYVLVITLMVVLATATVAEVGDPWLLIGAVLFYLSDLAVARDRFVAPSFWNRAWGSPMYFLGQLLLALTVR